MDILSLAARRVNPARASVGGPVPPEPDTVPPADRARINAAADEAAGGDVECNPAFWPSWTDDGRYELGPDPDDERWASEHLNETSDDEPPADHLPAGAEPDWDEMHREAWATHCLERGLAPFDPGLTADAAGLTP